MALNGQLTNQRSITGKDVKSVLDFDTEKNETIEVKVGISAVSVENAIQNLERKFPIGTLTVYWLGSLFV